MYLALFKERLSSWFGNARFGNGMRSSIMPALLIVLALSLGLAYRELGRGRLARLEAQIRGNEQPPQPTTPRPGGEEPLLLTRQPLMGGTLPEFISVTVLPGRGMNVLQIRASIPGMGEVDLLASPSLEQAAHAMTGSGDDLQGEASLDMGAAFETPWAGQMGGSPSPGGGHITSFWRGHTIDIPETGGGEDQPVALGGRMLGMGADSRNASNLPDGAHAEAVFAAKDFSTNWPSETEVTVTVVLSGRTIELTVAAHNLGNTAEPIGIGWHPRFALPLDNRAQWRLRIPADERAEVTAGPDRLPSGKLLPVARTAYDFTARGGASLGTMGLDDTFVHLQNDLMESGPAVELSDRAHNYGLKMTALTTTIKAIHVTAPAGQPYISIDPRFNFDDPFGHEWSKEPDTGMVVLEPGQSAHWKVRLELFQLSNSDARRH
jgi:galactose mutarotase-like enzyme